MAEQKKSLWQVLTIAVCLGAVQVAYTIEFTFCTPFFAQFGVKASQMPFYFLAGTVSGFIVQPIIGVYSDRCTSKFGRRRPYILWGGIGSMLGLEILGFCQELGAFFFKDHNMGAKVFGIIGLWVLNLCINVMQGPARALVPDLLPASQQTFGNSLISWMMGLANFFGNLAMSFNPNKLSSSLGDNFSILFQIGAIPLLLFFLPTLFWAKEKPITKKDADSVEKEEFVLVQIYKSGKTVPKPMLIVFAVYFLSWMAYMPYQIYITSWLATDVYGAKPKTKLFKEGVRKGSFGLALMAVVTLCFAPLLDPITKRIGVKLTYILTQVVAAACFLSTVVIRTLNPALAAIALVGINFATFNSIPFALVKDSNVEGQEGLFMGILNAACVIAQTIGMFLSGAIIGVTGDEKYGLAFGALMSVFCIFAVPLLRTGKVEQKTTKGTDESSETTYLLGVAGQDAGGTI